MLQRDLRGVPGGLRSRPSSTDADVTGLRPHQLAGRGLGRSFQNLALSPGSTVLDNVLVGRHARTRGGFLAAGLRSRAMQREQRRHTDRALEICAFLNLEHLAHSPVGALPYGDAKRVDIARAIATEPSVLLLDEPAAGMNSGRDRGHGHDHRRHPGGARASRCCWSSTT